MITAIIISAIAGATVGYTIAAMLMIGKRAEPKAPPKEPTRLFMVGNLVKWHGDVYTIEKFKTNSENQTIAFICDEETGAGGFMPIEELEAVEE